MIKFIRSLNSGWLIILIGLVVVISGISMKTGKVGENTFLCFDNGCIYIQGISSVIIGLLSIVLGIYLLIKK